jgi:hypothetical protein
MSNTVNLDDYEKLNFLFKNYLGFPNTDKTKPFFLETAVKANNYLFGGEIFLDTIPLTPDFDSGNGTNHNANSLNIDSNKLNASGSAIHTDSSNIVRRFTKIKLEKISGTQRGYYCLDQNNNNILKDALQFNVNKADDGTQPYLYKLYTNSGVNSDEQILPNAAGGNWIFDVKNGVVNFPDTITGYNVSESSPPYLTFYKYVGRKGLNQLSTTDIVGLGDQTQNIQLEITELSGNILDISNNIYRKSLLDISFNQINKSVTDLSNNVYSKSLLDNSFNQINKNVTDLSDNVYSKSLLDNSFNQINKSVTDLSNNVYSKAFLDNSFNQTNKSVTDLSNNVYSKNVLDNSFNQTNKSVTDLSNNVYSKNVLDNSFNQTNKSVTDLSNNVYSKNVLDNSFNQTNKSVTDLSNNIYSKNVLDNSFNKTNKNVTDLSNNVYSKNVLDNSFNKTNKSVTDLSDNVYSKAFLDNSFNKTNKSVTDLSNNVYSKAFLDNSFNQTNKIVIDLSNNVYSKAFLDNSFKNVYTKSNIDTKFNSLESEIDVSFNDVYNKKFINDLDSSLRNYVDGLVSGLDIKQSVKAATTDASNVSLELDYNVNGPLIIDGVTVLNGDRILLKNQSVKTENGIYELSGNKLQRTNDFNNGDNVTYGSFTFVELGFINNDKGFVLTKSIGSPSIINIDNTPLEFSQFSGAGQIIAGDGLNKQGETLSVNVDNQTISIVNDKIQINNVFKNKLDASLNKIDVSLNNVYTKSEVDKLTEGFTAIWEVNGDHSGYTFKGPGLIDNTVNATLYLTRGQKYKFQNKTTGHPFQIQTDDENDGTAYNKGVNNNRAGGPKGEVIFEVPMDAPSKLWYACTSPHPAMKGVIYIGDKLHDLSNNVYRKSVLDNSFNQINNSIVDLSNNVYSKSVLDNSFNQINNSIVDLSNNVYSKSVLDNSFNQINKSVTDLSKNIYSKVLLDNSFNQINKSVTDLSNNIYSKLLLDNSFNQINKSVTDLSNNIYSKALLDNSFNQINNSIVDLSNNVYSKSVLDNSFNNIYTKSEVDELTKGFTAVWEVSGDHNGYKFKGPGLEDDTVNATIYLTRGEKYKFQNKTSGHPFQIQTDDENDGAAYNKGVSNNRAGGPKGEVIFEVPMDAPSKLWYACTSPHPAMHGVIYIGDKIHDLSNNVYHKELLYNKSEIDTKVSLINSKIDLSFNKLDDNINDLSNNSYSKSEINSKIDNIKLNNLSDVNVTTVQNDQYLKYDSSTSKWVASTITTTNTGGGSSSGGSGSSAVVNNRNQTFFELLTQQPNQFTAGSTSSSSSQITINWNYDDIVPTHDVGVFAKLMFPSASADRLLPHIDEIRFDVSGVNTLNSNYSQFWVNDSGSTISLNSSNDYNSGSTYKSKIFPKTALSNANNSQIENILSKTTPIDIRVYGVVNNGIDYPNVNSRALVFRGLQFSAASAPSQPIRQSVESISATSNSFTVNYSVSQTESGVNGSSARINSITGKYTELTGTDTLVSTIITQTDAGDEQTKTTSLNLLNIGQNLPITFDNLRFGTKYTYKVSVKNNFSSTPSDDSAENKMSNFTRIPQAGSNNLILDIHTDSLKNILKPSSSLLSNIVYVNISESTGLKFANTNLQTFEVTDTSATTSSAGGVGKGVDDENDIAQIEISKNVNGGAYTSLQLIKYSGFDISTKTVKDFSKSTNNIITNVSTNDKYSSYPLSKGFRIEGKFQLINIASSDITSLIGTASSDPYGIRLSYTRTYGTGSNQTKAVYIDDLGTDPSITKTSGETFNITDQLYTMGIASVKEFDATFDRTYNNICSQYGFIPGDGKIGEITSIAGTNKSSSTTSVTITSSEIPTSTPFNKTKQTTISNVFYNTGTLLSNSKTFVVKEKAFSLKKPDGIPSDGGSDTITIKHFCDRNSYNISSNQIYSRKFNTTFYEITDATELGKLNTNIGSIGVTEYTDHTTSIKPWTLLYIDGKLQTNNAQAYPDFSNSNFNQTGITTASTYSSGTSSYDLTGTSTGGNNNGYKWIVFKIPSNSSTYVKEASSKTGGAALPYIDVPAFIDSLPFNSTSDIKTKINAGFGSQNVVGFIRIINSNDNICIGRFTSNKVANNLWYLGGNTSSVSLSNVLANDGVGQVYGSLIDTGNHNVANGWGVECPTQSNFKSGSDIEIFIGLKNNVSL